MPLWVMEFKFGIGLLEIGVTLFLFSSLDDFYIPSIKIPLRVILFMSNYVLTKQYEKRLCNLKAIEAKNFQSFPCPSHFFSKCVSCEGYEYRVNGRVKQNAT